MKKNPKKTYSALLKYDFVFNNITKLIDDARRFSAKSVNVIMTATYWEIGRRIVEYEQKGSKRAQYGKAILKQLSSDLSAHFGKGFSRQNLQLMRQFYLTYSQVKRQTPSSISLSNEKRQTASVISNLTELQNKFPLPWSAYVSLLSIKDNNARGFYETEALRNGWSVRQLNRQINSMFYERIALSKNKVSMLKKAEIAKKEDKTLPEEEIKDAYILEFLDLKDEYSESDLEEALILHLEKFLLELGGNFAFVGRQKRLRIGEKWYRVDLIFFHRKLKCLVIIDLKIGKFSYSDAGQMHMYLNYAKENWMNNDENPPVGLILCAEKNETLAKYSLKDLPNKVIAAEYKTVLPDEKIIAAELKKAKNILESRKKK
ncbi:DUF1016 family protein [bacterium]|nr:DUF1016 family protein [bacterium]